MNNTSTFAPEGRSGGGEGGAEGESDRDIVYLIIVDERLGWI